MFRSDLENGQYWENRVLDFLLEWGYDAEMYGDGKSRQLYVYLDGEEYPHPDIIIKVFPNKDVRKEYVEVKHMGRYYSQGGREYVTIKKFNFDAYLQLAQWLERRVSIVFPVGNRKKCVWITKDVFELDKIKACATDIYLPRERGEYYMFDVSQGFRTIKSE